MMENKGLNPNRTKDIALLTHNDYLQYYDSVTDDDSDEARQTTTLCHQLADSVVENMNITFQGKIWNPSDILPFNDITRAYYAAVKLFRSSFKVSKNDEQLHFRKPSPVLDSETETDEDSDDTDQPIKQSSNVKSEKPKKSVVYMKNQTKKCGMMKAKMTGQ